MADNRLIPSGIRDTNTIALNELIDKMGTIDLTPLLVYIIDNVKSSALIHLAEQFHVAGLEGWIFAKTDYEKRKLIKTAIKTHRIKGTSGAIKQALESIGFGVTVYSGEEYAGRPDRFAVKLVSSSQIYNEAAQNKVIEIINEYKNVRSVLDGLVIELINKAAHPVIGGTIMDGEIITIHPYAQKSQLLLNLISGTKVIAGSLRQLDVNNTGHLIEVSRDADDEILYLNATDLGQIDTTALLTFAGSGSAYIAKIKDKSGSGRDLVQPDKIKQPRIVNNGTLVTLSNGKPAFEMHHAAAGFFLEEGLMSRSWDDADKFDLFLSYECPQAISTGTVWHEWNPSNGNIYYRIRNESSLSQFVCRGWNGTTLIYQTGKPTILPASMQTMINDELIDAKGLLLNQTVTLNLGNITVQLNDTEILDVAITVNTNSNTTITHILNDRYWAAAPVGMKVSDIMLFKNLTDNERIFIRNNCINYMNEV